MKAPSVSFRCDTYNWDTQTSLFIALNQKAWSHVRWLMRLVLSAVHAFHLIFIRKHSSRPCSAKDFNFLI